MNILIDTMVRWSAAAAPQAWAMLWQSSLLIALVLLVDLALRRKVRPAVLHGLWLLVLVKLLLPPNLSFPTGAAWWLRPRATAPESRYIVRYGPDLTPATPDEVAAGAQAPARTAFSSSAWVLTCWAAVSLGFLGWMLVRWRQMARQVQAAAPAPDLLNGLLEDTRLATGLRRRVRLRLIDGPVSPAVCGLVHPTILLPRRVAEELPVPQLRVVLLHELLHIRRGDVWIGCLQALLLAAYWWHPLVWVANARLRRTREEAVDDAVMRASGTGREDYPSALLQVARFIAQRPALSLGLVGILESRSALRQRIQRLLDSRVPDRPGLTLTSILTLVAFGALALPMGQAPGPQQQPAAPPAQIPMTAPPAENANASHPLYTRIYKLDPHTVEYSLQNQGLLELNDDVLPGMRKFLLRAGIDLQPPKTLYYKDREGRLLVRASLSDLERIESLIQALNTAPAQVNFIVKFVELTPSDERAFWSRFSTSAPPAEGQRTALLNPRELQKLLDDWKRGSQNSTLQEANVTTLSGRQAQVQWVNLMGVVGYTNAPDGTLLSKTAPIGPTVDVLAVVPAHSHTIQLTTSTVFTEFLGYDDPGPFLPIGMSTPVTTLPVPHLRRHQLKELTVSVPDGETLAIGGTASAETVPPSRETLLPDQAKHFLILITPTLVDPAGNRLYPAPGK